jgi:hypothetical protein
VKSLEPSAEVLEAREFLRSRILERAVHEGSPLSQLEVDYLDSDHLPNEREIMERFEREFEFQGYIEYIGGLLRRARENDAGTDPEAADKYEAMAKRLESSPQDFILFSCAVMGLSDLKPSLKWPWVAVILFLAALAAYYSLKWQGFGWRSLFQ